MTKRKSKSRKTTVKATAATGAVKRSSSSAPAPATPLIVLGFDDQQKPGVVGGDCARPQRRHVHPAVPRLPAPPQVRPAPQRGPRGALHPLLLRMVRRTPEVPTRLGAELLIPCGSVCDTPPGFVADFTRVAQAHGGRLTLDSRQYQKHQMQGLLLRTRHAARFAELAVRRLQCIIDVPPMCTTGRPLASDAVYMAATDRYDQ
jgi:hypothetical protein